MALTPGALIAGRYRVDRRIGAGGMSEVWIGEHVAVGVDVALKTLLPDIAEDREILARFKREAYLLGRIRSDYIVRVIDFIAEEGADLVLVMEYVNGTPLDRLLQTRKLTVEETLDVGVDVATALCDLHRARIVHRDLKPGNIILRPHGDGGSRAVIVDFGISRLVAEDGEEQEMTGITKINTAIGTIEYMAPEQLLNSRDVTGASDIYALGAMLFRAVAGHHIFGDLREHRLAQAKLVKDAPRVDSGRDDALAEGFATVLARMIARRPSERYQHAEEVLADLTALRAPASAPRPDAVPAAVAEPTAKLEPSSRSARMPVATEPSNPSGPHAMAEARPPMPSQHDARPPVPSQHDARPPMPSQNDARPPVPSQNDARPPMPSQQEPCGARPPMESSGAALASPATPNAFAAPAVPAAIAAPAAPANRTARILALVLPAVLVALVGGVGLGTLVVKMTASPKPAASAEPATIPATSPSAAESAADVPSAAPVASAAAVPSATPSASAAPVPSAEAVPSAPAATSASASPGPVHAAPHAAAPAAVPSAAPAAPTTAAPQQGEPAPTTKPTPRPAPTSAPVVPAPTGKGTTPDVGNVGF